MALITWNDSYSVKVQRCDQEHQKLFDLINNLYDAMREGKGNEASAKIVQELGNYTRSHFAAEEALMQRANYPKLAAHKIEHAKFVAEVEKLKSDIASGRSANSVSLLSFLKDWLSKHIKKIDQEYSEHLNAAGIK